MDLSRDMDKPIGNGVKGQAMLLQLDRSDLPQLYADALHVIPHSDGTVAIGSTSERAFEDPTSTDAQLEAIHSRAIAAVPALKDAQILARWAGGATTRQKPRANAWYSPNAPKGIHRKRRVQDRLWHGPQGR